MEREPGDDQIPHHDAPNGSQSEDEQQPGTSRIRNRSSSTPHSSERSILQKPAIPPILRSSSGPVQSPEDNASAGSRAKIKRSSILKKKRQDGHGPTVSFELDPALSRAKSSDSNLSFESETGYWSGGSGGSGILKGCKSDSESSSSDGKSILKQRRASLGNLTSENDPDSNELHSILKRKLSYDSSVLLNSTKSSQFSLSTHSLPTDMSDVSPEPKPILKNKYNSSDEQLLDDNVEEQTQHTPRPILKNGAKRNGSRGTTGEPIRPILKRSSHSVEMRHDDQSPSGKGILKRSSSNSRRQSGGSDTLLNPDDFKHESAVGFMLNQDDGLESRFRHSESPHRRTGSTTSRSESEEEIMLGLSLAEKRSVLIQMDSASVDRGSRPKRRGRVDKHSDAHPLINSDRNSPHHDLEASRQMHRLKAESAGPVEISAAALNAKGQLLSSILGEISDSHAKKQQVVNFEGITPRRRTTSEGDTTEKSVAGICHSSTSNTTEEDNVATTVEIQRPDACTKQAHFRVENNNLECEARCEGLKIEMENQAHTWRRLPGSSSTLMTPMQGTCDRNGRSLGEPMDLELRTDRLSLNDQE